MNRRDALLGLSATLLAGTRSEGQDAAAPASKGEDAGGPAPAAPTCIPTTERVFIRYSERAFDIHPPIALLALPKAGAPPPSLKWDIDIPLDHALEINFVVDYDGESHVVLNTPSMRGPFARARNPIRGRYLARGPATGENALDSGRLDITKESYWKYEITVFGPNGNALLAIDPGVIVKEGEI
jgi:hypothetical protein